MYLLVRTHFYQEMLRLNNKINALNLYENNWRNNSVDTSNIAFLECKDKAESRSG
jgi:hypothetical protein